MHSPPPSDDDLDPTIAMPRVEMPPPARPRVERGSFEPEVRPETAPPRERPPVDVTPAAAVAEPAGPRFVIGNPVGYAVARLFAFVLDVLLVGVFVTSLAYSLIAINPLTGLPTNSQQGFDATLAVGFAVALLYVVLAEALFGTTVWKLAFGLHVYAMRGGLVGLGRALVRMLLRPIDVLLIGGILAVLPGHRRLGDLLGGTIVARSPLRAFAPLVGWILIIVLAGLPFAITGPEHALASLVAFGEFVPGLVDRLVLLGRELLNLPQ